MLVFRNDLVSLQKGLVFGYNLKSTIIVEPCVDTAFISYNYRKAVRDPSKGFDLKI